MILKLIFLGIVVWLGLRIYRLGKKIQATGNITTTAGGDMVCCKCCGLYLPPNESIERNGFHYCSEEHASAHGQKNGTEKHPVE